MADRTVKRRLTFSAWADGSQRKPFDLGEAATTVAAIDTDEQVLEHVDQLTAVQIDQVGDDSEPTKLRLLALRDYENRPLNWGPGADAVPITIGEDRYVADITHVVLWSDKIAAHDVFSNAPGLGR